jgi:hypothetical protein
MLLSTTTKPALDLIRAERNQLERLPEPILLMKKAMKSKK